MGCRPRSSSASCTSLWATAVIGERMAGKTTQSACFYEPLLPRRNGAKERERGKLLHAHACPWRCSWTRSRRSCSSCGIARNSTVLDTVLDRAAVDAQQKGSGFLSPAERVAGLGGDTLVLQDVRERVCTRPQATQTQDITSLCSGLLECQEDILSRVQGSSLTQHVCVSCCSTVR